MSLKMLSRISETSVILDYVTSRKALAPTDSLELLKRVTARYGNREGAVAGEYDDPRDDDLREITRLVKETFAYRETYMLEELNLSARHFSFPMARVSLVAEMYCHTSSWREWQCTEDEERRFDHRAVMRLLDGHYDDYLVDDRLPLPFKYLEEYRD